jgi:hypothetical protein
LKDLILKKNMIIGNQIISISDCLRDKEGEPSSGKDLEKKKSSSKTNEKKISGKVVLCLSNTPDSLCRMLCKIFGLSDFKTILTDTGQDREVFRGIKPLMHNYLFFQKIL